MRAARGAISALVAVLCLSLAAPTEAATPQTNLQLAANLEAVAKRVARNLPGNAAVVFSDPATGEVLFSQNANASLLPASTMKLFTAAVALETYSPDHRITTKAVWDAKRHRLYLVGSGDPSLSRSSMAKLAAKVAPHLPAGKIAVYADGSAFPEPKDAVGWVKGYIPGQVNSVTALTLSGVQTAHPNRNTAQSFTSALIRAGVKAHFAGTGVAKGTAVGQVSGLPLLKIVRKMLVHSDNDVAEHLFRLSAASTGKLPTWKESVKFAESSLSALGIDAAALTINDGSGLSRKDRVSARSLVDLLTAARSSEHPRLTALLDSHLLAIAGEDGTLKLRFRSAKTKCATSQVEAKTGSLKDVVSLAGYVHTDSGLAAFAIVVNRVDRGSINQLRSRIDWIVSAVAAGC